MTMLRFSAQDSLSSLELGAGRVGRKRVDTEGEDGGAEALRPSGKPTHHHRHYSLGASSQVKGCLYNDVTTLGEVVEDFVTTVHKPLLKKA